LYYNRFRYYDPEIGQYIQQDPIGLEGGNPTLYGYVEDPNIYTDPFGLNVCPVSRKAAIKHEGLPTRGRIRYVPPKNWNQSQRLPTRAIGGGRRGFVDKFDNVWTRGPSRTAGQSFEWDVQLSKSGRQQLGWASRDGSHLNISLDGRITHK